MADDNKRDFEIIKEFDDEIRRLEREAAALTRKIAPLEKKARLRAELLAMDDEELAKMLPERFRPKRRRAVTSRHPRQHTNLMVEGSVPRSRQPAGRQRNKAKPERVSHAKMVDWCRTILEEEEGGPMTVSAIRQRLEDNPAWQVPGKGDNANVTVHLARSPEFEPGEKRGTWRIAKQ